MREGDARVGLLWAWGATMALREPEDYRRRHPSGSNYTIDPAKGDSRKERERHGERTEVLPESKRPVLTGSGRMYATGAMGDHLQEVDDPAPGFWPFMAVERAIFAYEETERQHGRLAPGAVSELRAFAMHRYMRRGRVTDFSYGISLHRQLLDLIPTEDLGAGDRELAAAIELEKRVMREMDAERKRRSRRKAREEKREAA